jgi:hypothetical protein
LKFSAAEDIVREDSMSGLDERTQRAGKMAVCGAIPGEWLSNFTPGKDNDVLILQQGTE